MIYVSSARNEQKLLNKLTRCDWNETRVIYKANINSLQCASQNIEALWATSAPGDW